MVSAMPCGTIMHLNRVDCSVGTMRNSIGTYSLGRKEMYFPIGVLRPLSINEVRPELHEIVPSMGATVRS